VFPEISLKVNTEDIFHNPFNTHPFFANQSCIQLFSPPHDELDVPIPPWLSLRDLILGKLTEIHHGSSIFRS